MRSPFVFLATLFTLAAVLMGVGQAYHQIFFRGPIKLQDLMKGGSQNVLKPTGVPTATPKLPPIITGEPRLKVPILLYHYIENPPAEDKTRVGLSTPPIILDMQLQLLLSNGFTPITFDELAAAMNGSLALPTKPVILTFDDGYADFYTNAYPILVKYKMKAIAFIPTGLIGGGNYMTWAQIEELSHSAYVIFEAHSVHHYYLPKISDAVLNKELEESKQVLSRHVGYPINWMAYPYGAFDERVVAATKRAGFLGSATTLSGSIQYQSRFFYIPRYRVGRRLGDDFLKLVR